MSYIKNDETIFAAALRVLRTFPLCDRCLGRLFAQYGVNLNNELRGKAIKTYIAMLLAEKISRGENTVELIMELGPNAGYPISELYKRYVSSDLMIKKCYICNNKLSTLIGELAIRSVEALMKVKVSTFLVGVKKDSTMEQREKEVATILGTDSWESIRREIKREVGKKIRAVLGIEPEFRNPDVIVVLDLDKVEATLTLMPLYLKGKYLKFGRYISQMVWIGKDGAKKYKLSVEEECRKLLDIVSGINIRIHASGREDVDARMLGNGRPLIIEVSNPKNRDVDLSRVREALTGNPWVRVVVDKKVSPSAVTWLKESNPHKVYRVVTYSDGKISNIELHNLRKFFTNRTIKQLTPRRVLGRKKEHLRIKKVYEVNAKLLHSNIIEFVVKCDGGLYVKELVHGDDGRTSPSFAEFLQKNLTVLLLDVLKVGDG